MAKTSIITLYHTKRAFWYWFFTYLIVFVASGIVMKILEVNMVIPDDQAVSKVFSINSDAFADSMTYRWIIGLPLWILFSRYYFLQMKATHVLHIKAEAIQLTIFWVVLTIGADIFIWIVIPYLIHNHPWAFVKDSWPWLVLRYAVIYLSTTIGQAPAKQKIMNKRF